MSVPNTSAQRAFLKGIQKIYKSLFQYGRIRFLDTENTNVDPVYGETSEKYYTEGYEVLCHFTRDRNKDSEPMKDTEEKVIIKVPIQEFLDKGIAFSSNEDIDVLMHCILEFNGERYRVDEVNPYSMVAGQFLMCQFRCQREEGIILTTPEVSEEESDTDVEV